MSRIQNILLAFALCGTSVVSADVVNKELLTPDPEPIEALGVERPNSVEYKAVKHSDNWKSLGKGRYTEDFITTMFRVPNYTWEVEYQENIDEPGVYKIVNPFGEGCPYITGKGVDFDIIVNASNPNRVYVETVETSLDFGYGPITFSSWAAYFMEKDNLKPEEVTDSYFGVMRDGVIIFPFKYLLVRMRDYISNSAFYANCNRQGIFRLPGSKTYDLSISNDLMPINPETAELNYKSSTDFYKVKYVFKKAYDNTNYYGLNEKSFVHAMEQGTELKQGEGKLTFDLTKEGRGKYICYIAGYTEDGTIMARATTDFFYDKDTPSEWTSIGDGKLTEDFFSNVVGTNPTTWDVQVEVNNADPNFYRLVNPYKNFKPVENTKYDTSRNYYIYLHLEKLKNEIIGYIEESLIGIDVGYGPTKVTCTATLYNMWGNSWAVIKNFHQTMPLFASFDDEKRKVSFIKEQGWISMPLRQGGEYIYTNAKGKLAITLPQVGDSGLTDVIADDAMSTPEYYDLNGIKVSPERLAPGIYVKRTGSKVEKVVIGR